MRSVYVLLAVGLLLTGCYSRHGDIKQIENISDVLTRNGFQACLKIRVNATYAAFADGSIDIAAVRGGANLHECMGLPPPPSYLILQTTPVPTVHQGVPLP